MTRLIGTICSLVVLTACGGGGGGDIVAGFQLPDFEPLVRAIIFGGVASFSSEQNNTLEEIKAAAKAISDEYLKVETEGGG